MDNLQDLFAMADSIMSKDIYKDEDADVEAILAKYDNDLSEEEQYERDIAEMLAEMADIPDDEIHLYV